MRCPCALWSRAFLTGDDVDAGRDKKLAEHAEGIDLVRNEAAAEQRGAVMARLDKLALGELEVRTRGRGLADRHLPLTDLGMVWLCQMDNQLMALHDFCQLRFMEPDLKPKPAQ